MGKMLERLVIKIDNYEIAPYNFSVRKNYKWQWKSIAKGRVS